MVRIHSGFRQPISVIFFVTFTVTIHCNSDHFLLQCGAGYGDNCCSQVPEVKETLIHKTSYGDAILLILALCFHSVFEGIAIGVAGLFQIPLESLKSATLNVTVK